MQGAIHKRSDARERERERERERREVERAGAGADPGKRRGDREERVHVQGSWG